MMYDETFLYAQTYTFSRGSSESTLDERYLSILFRLCFRYFVLGFLFSSRTFYEQPNKSNKHIQIIG